MFVCHCRAVSDGDVRWCIAEGACDVDEIGRRCGAGTGCGGCRGALAQLLAALDRRTLVTSGGPADRGLAVEQN
ncbi:MAG TPA: (2Fe-2S)-binding protein [Acidimicrobiales bacterium]|nr:(2Fe-2S)-binding protein [Acidimicrobiales bacterium]